MIKSWNGLTNQIIQLNELNRQFDGPNVKSCQRSAIRISWDVTNALTKVKHNTNNRTRRMIKSWNGFRAAATFEVFGCAGTRRSQSEEQETRQ